ELFLALLTDMGHTLNHTPQGLELIATKEPKTVSFRTMPYPGFPPDLQPSMLAAQTIATGTSTVWETVYEWRLGHVRELQRMGAQITVQGDMLAVIRGVAELRGCTVVAGDIRAGA